MKIGGLIRIRVLCDHLSFSKSIPTPISGHSGRSDLFFHSQFQLPVPAWASPFLKKDALIWFTNRHQSGTRVQKIILKNLPTRYTLNLSWNSSSQCVLSSSCSPGLFSAESWDLGLGVPYMQGRMKQYLPLFLELGVTSVKGYGFSWNYLPSSAGLGESEFKEYEKTNTETYRSNSSQEKYWENTFKTRLSLSSNAFHFYYRIEQYVHRWDLGMIYNTNTYSVRHKKEVRDCTRYISWGSTICSSSTTGALEEKSSDYEVNYLGPFAQYSNTLPGSAYL